MSNMTITVSEITVDGSPTLTLTGQGTGGSTFSSDTMTLPPGTFTVTITEGASVTLAPSVQLPTVFSCNRVRVSSGLADLVNGEYVFTCTNDLTKGDSALTTNFTVSASFGTNHTTFFPDPTIEFEPEAGSPPFDPTSEE